MASGRLGAASLTASTDTDVYTVPTGMVATANINFCNRTADAIRIRLAARTGTLSNAHYIEYDAVVPPNGALERTGIALSAGEVITCRADADGISVRVHGFEESV